MQDKHNQQVPPSAQEKITLKKVDAGEFEHELTQIYLELKGSFTASRIAETHPAPVIQKEQLAPKLDWNPTQITTSLPHGQQLHLAQTEVKELNVENCIAVLPQVFPKIKIPPVQDYSGLVHSPRPVAVSTACVQWKPADLGKIRTSRVEIITASAKPVTQVIPELSNKIGKQEAVAAKISDFSIKNTDTKAMNVAPARTVRIPSVYDLLSGNPVSGIAVSLVPAKTNAVHAYVPSKMQAVRTPIMANVRKFPLIEGGDLSNIGGQKVVTAKTDWQEKPLQSKSVHGDTAPKAARITYLEKPTVLGLSQISPITIKTARKDFQLPKLERDEDSVPVVPILASTQISNEPDLQVKTKNVPVYFAEVKLPKFSTETIHDIAGPSICEPDTRHDDCQVSASSEVIHVSPAFANISAQKSDMEFRVPHSQVPMISANAAGGLASAEFDISIPEVQVVTAEVGVTELSDYVLKTQSIYCQEANITACRTYSSADFPIKTCTVVIPSLPEPPDLFLPVRPLTRFQNEPQTMDVLAVWKELNYSEVFAKEGLILNFDKR